MAYSLNNLAGATGFTQGANVSLGTIEGSPTAGENISIGSFALTSVTAPTGYTYAVEGTSETYTAGTAGGSRKSYIENYTPNWTWTVPAGSKISLGTNSGKSAVFSISSMTNLPTQTVLQSIISHTIRLVFQDNFSEGCTNRGSNLDKTVYSVDSYDGNSAALCLTIDSPVILADGTIVEAGDLNEGDKLKGFSIGGLGTDSDGTFLDWSSDSLSTTPKDVTIVNLTYSFASRYYDVNNGEVTATAEHPMLVKDSVSGNYIFKEMFNLVVGDKLIKGDGTEVSITSIEAVQKTTEIVSIDVEEEDTYMVNGYITHNKGGNSHSDFSGPAAPTSLAYSSPFVSWTVPANTTSVGVTAVQVQIANNAGFTTPTIDYDEWSDPNIEVNTLLSAGTWYARVRAIEAGLKGAWSSTLTFTR